MLATAAFGQVFPVPDSLVQHALDGRKGTLILMDCESGQINDFNPAASAEKLAPCSTFKIWNTLIGLQLGLISSPNEPFYKWDGEKRFIADWNKDLTLKEAFQVSCVPAFQALARKIGEKHMQTWLNKIHYGDGDISAGIDVFWLPRQGSKTILISPLEQVRLIHALLTNQLPFSEKAQSALKKIMLIRKTERGAFYGKTGSGFNQARGAFNLGWFVGYVEVERKTYAFTCMIQGENASGKVAREIVEDILKSKKLL
ncbi:class D beta-lactamase [Chloroherpeton thalassium]|nr:class D beta-lactamase [Chloroherpeton thalassium]